MKPPRYLGSIVAALALLAIVYAISIPNLLRSPAAARDAARMARERAGAQAFQANSTVSAAGPMIVRTAVLSMISNEFENARATLDDVSRRHHGYVAKLGITNEGGGERTLAATLRIPADQLDPAMAELRKLGRVQQESQTSDEVTQQYVDLVARLNNSRATEQRLVEVLQQRTGKVGDVLEVEKEVGRVREEIERMEAQLRNLDNQVSLASLDLRVTEELKKPFAAPPSAGTAVWNATVEGLREAVDEALGLLLFFLHYAPSLLFWIALLFWPLRLGWRRLRAS